MLAASRGWRRDRSGHIETMEFEDAGPRKLSVHRTVYPTRKKATEDIERYITISTVMIFSAGFIAHTAWARDSPGNAGEDLCLRSK
jgi:hypothetical protein